MKEPNRPERDLIIFFEFAKVALKVSFFSIMRMILVGIYAEG